MKQIKMLAHLMLAGLFGALTAASQTEVQVLDDSIPGQALSIDRLGQSAQAELKPLRVRLVAASGPVDLDILMLRELSTGLFVWRFSDGSDGSLLESLETFRTNHVVAMTDQKLAIFACMMPELWVRESTERYPSMQEGRAAVLATLAEKGAEIERDNYEQFVRIPLGDRLSHEFLVTEGGFPSDTPIVTGATGTGAQWTVRLRGVNAENGSLVLSDTLAPVSASPARQPVQAIVE